jgi:AraC-like DNA-binding protein
MPDMTRLRELIGRHAREGLTPTALPGVSLLRATAVSGPLGEVAEPAVAIIAQGVKETALNGRVFRHGPGQFAVVPVELPVTGHITQASPGVPLLACVLLLRQQKIAALLAELAPAAPAPPRPSAGLPSGIAVSDASPDLLDAVTRLLALLDDPGAAAVLGDGIEREVLWRLLAGPQGAGVRQVGLADSRLAHLARAITFIRGHYDQTLRVADLAAQATMSVTSFHRHFRALTAMTPIQFQKTIRLHQARARLLADPADVAGAGYAVGYGSPSQFSREYRRMFGVPPSRDAPAGFLGRPLPATELSPHGGDIAQQRRQGTVVDHLVAGRDGEVVQRAGDSGGALHAGRSRVQRQYRPARVEVGQEQPSAGTGHPVHLGQRVLAPAGGHVVQGQRARHHVEGRVREGRQVLRDAGHERRAGRGAAAGGGDGRGGGVDARHRAGRARRGGQQPGQVAAAAAHVEDPVARPGPGPGDDFPVDPPTAPAEGKPGHQRVQPVPVKRSARRAGTLVQAPQCFVHAGRSVL